MNRLLTRSCPARPSRHKLGENSNDNLDDIRRADSLPLPGSPNPAVIRSVAMSIRQSTHRRRQKPAKPNPSFPLTPHNSRQWCKKIRGKVRLFGIWEEPEAALENYLRVAADLHGGREPRSSTISALGVAVKQLCNHPAVKNLAVWCGGVGAWWRGGEGVAHGGPGRRGAAGRGGERAGPRPGTSAAGGAYEGLRRIWMRAAAATSSASAPMR